MLKFSFLVGCFLFTGLLAIGQAKDTVITYYKFSSSPIGWKVSTADSADYVRLVYPSSAGKFYDIREYYANGSIKLLGTIDFPTNAHIITFIGDYMSYYQNGKKQSIAHFTDGKKLGFEYLFRPNGKLYAVKKWVYKYVVYNDELFWEFYDDDGNMICQNGNGKWLGYDKDFKRVTISGNIKNGLKEGEWKGYDILDDTVNYVFNYEKNVLVSGRGYDKNGNVYPFKNAYEDAIYKKGDLFTFLKDLNKYTLLPKNSDGKKMNIDTVHISFIVEKDGSISNLEPVGNVNPHLKEALNNAISKCGRWIPNKYYGLPYREWFILSLKVKEDFMVSSVSKVTDFKRNTTQSFKGYKIEADPN